MAVHQIKIDTNAEYYSLWNDHKRAIYTSYVKDKYELWDTIVFTCDIPRWTNLPIYRRISLIEYMGFNEMLLHLK